MRGKNQKLVKKDAARTMAANVARHSLLPSRFAWATMLMAMARPLTLNEHALHELRAGVAAAIAARRLPGAVAWVERLGAAPFVEAFGQRAWEPAPEPLATDAVFDIASLTKPMVGILAARCLERGLFELDDPVARHMPGLHHAMTWRHLLTHSSGLPAVLPLTPDWSGREPALTLARAAIPTHQPGTLFRYSDINYILLGALLEGVTSAPLHELAAHEIFTPLEMRDARYRPLELHAAMCIVPTEFEGARMLRGVVHDPAARRMGGVAGHAGVFSTAADLARLARCLLSGGEPLMQPHTLALMTRSASPHGMPARGLGWDIASAYSRPRGALFPMGSYGHTGFTGCVLWLDPHSRSFYVFLSNRVHPRGNESIVALYEQVGTWAARAVGLQ